MEKEKKTKVEKVEETETTETEVVEDMEVQTTFNEDGIDVLVEEGSVENVYNENE